MGSASPPEFEVQAECFPLGQAEACVMFASESRSQNCREQEDILKMKPVWKIPLSQVPGTARMYEALREEGAGKYSLPEFMNFTLFGVGPFLW